MVPVFQLVPCVSSFHLIPLRSVWLHLLYSLNPAPIRDWYTLRSPWSFFWGWRVPLLNLLMNNRCSKPFCNFHGLWLESLKYVLVSLVLGSLEPNPTLTLVLSGGTRSPHPTCCHSSWCSTTIWCISHSFRFCIGCKLADDASSHHPGHLWRHQTVLAPVATPGCASGKLPPVGLCAANDHNPLCPKTSFSFQSIMFISATNSSSACLWGNNGWKKVLLKSR